MPLSCTHLILGQKVLAEDCGLIFGLSQYSRFNNPHRQPEHMPHVQESDKKKTWKQRGSVICIGPRLAQIDENFLMHHLDTIILLIKLEGTSCIDTVIQSIHCRIATDLC